MEERLKRNEDILVFHLPHLSTKVILVCLPCFCLERVILQEQLLQLVRCVEISFLCLLIFISYDSIRDEGAGIHRV